MSSTGSSERELSAVDAGSSRVNDDHPAVYRYGVVLILVSVLVVFEIVAPDADWSRAVAFALEAAALVVVIATSRARSEIRRARALVVGVGTMLVVIGIASSNAGRCTISPRSGSLRPPASTASASG